MGKGLGTRLKYHEGGGGREELCIEKRNGYVKIWEWLYLVLSAVYYVHLVS